MKETEVGIVDKAVGVYIFIDETAEELLYKLPAARHGVEVVVAYKDQEKEYTLKEFLQKLGFKEGEQS